MTLDETHDPARRSWIESANRPDADFPIQNLPFGVLRTATDEASRVGVAIGDQVLDLYALAEAGHLDHLAAAEACQAPSLNALMALAPEARRELRRELSRLLSSDVKRLVPEAGRLLLPRDELRLALPAVIGDYTDFYASVYHATNVGSMFRPEHPLLPNYKWVPIGYHGRSSSIVPSGAPVPRPVGQRRPPDAAEPEVGPSRQLDYELEIGAWIAGENPLGEPVPIEQAEARLFGVSLLNDWSARDIQSWEYQPLGPFLGKSFATTVSPWVVTLEALAPFRAPAFTRPPGDPAPLPYLDSAANRSAGGLAITLDVAISSSRMRALDMTPMRVSRTDFRQMYWTLAQMVAHHTSNGCNLRPGDLLGSGTVSGPGTEERGCLLELTWRGKEPLTLPTGERRSFLEDGDEVVMTGWCVAPGTVRIGLGECRGRVGGREA
jgi:fumarylacetoacetase